MKKIGIVGYGQFTRFIAPILANYFEVLVFSRSEQLNTENVKFFTLDEVGAFEDLDFLVFSVPLQALEETCKKIQYSVSEKTVIIDVTSVKVKPLKILQQYFLNNQILGTHPIFGPQSGKNSIENLPIVLTNVSLDDSFYQSVKDFLSEELKLRVIEKTALEHDKEMAMVQGLSHFIGRVLKRLEINDFETATNSYKQLINLKELVGNDSWDLYKTIQNGNPYTDKVRNDFLEELQKLESELLSER